MEENGLVFTPNVSKSPDFVFGGDLTQYWATRILANQLELPPALSNVRLIRLGGGSSPGQLGDGGPGNSPPGDDGEA
jgi:hypothetical protein